MDKKTFLDKLKSGRLQWDSLLLLIPREWMVQPGVAGKWSIKDIIAHVSWHDQQMLGILHAHAFVGSDLWNLPLDQRNAAIHEQNRLRSLADIMAEGQHIFPQLVAAIDLLSDVDLNDPACFPGMPPAWQPWDVIAGNTYGHYEEHTPAVQAWLAQRDARTDGHLDQCEGLSAKGTP